MPDRTSPGYTRSASPVERPGQGRKVGDWKKYEHRRWNNATKKEDENRNMEHWSALVSMLQLGKVQNLGRELERLRVEICGITEVRWSGRGHFDTSEGHMIIYSGKESQGHSGVGVWIHEGGRWR